MNATKPTQTRRASPGSHKRTEKTLVPTLEKSRIMLPECFYTSLYSVLTNQNRAAPEWHITSKTQKLQPKQTRIRFSLLRASTHSTNVLICNGDFLRNRTVYSFVSEKKIWRSFQSESTLIFQFQLGNKSFYGS